MADRQPPVFMCTICRAGFSKDQALAYQGHVVRCAEDHEEELRAQSPRERAPGIWGDEGADVEFEKWVRDHRDELIEGRKRI